MKSHSDANKPVPPQSDDTQRESQRSHGDQQHRTKKEGHVSQIGVVSENGKNRTLSMRGGWYPAL